MPDLEGGRKFVYKSAEGDGTIGLLAVETFPICHDAVSDGCSLCNFYFVNQKEGTFVATTPFLTVDMLRCKGFIPTRESLILLRLPQSTLDLVGSLLKEMYADRIEYEALPVSSEVHDGIILDQILEVLQSRNYTSTEVIKDKPVEKE